MFSFLPWDGKCLLIINILYLSLEFILCSKRLIWTVTTLLHFNGYPPNFRRMPKNTLSFQFVTMKTSLTGEYEKMDQEVIYYFTESFLNSWPHSRLMLKLLNLNCGVCGWKPFASEIHCWRITSLRTVPYFFFCCAMQLRWLLFTHEGGEVYINNIKSK